MTRSGKGSALYIGWDVGGWNCDKNSKSRDALVILDKNRNIVGEPWRHNLRDAINRATSSREWIEALLALCKVELPANAVPNITLAIDTPLAFSKEFRALINGNGYASGIGTSASNPYLFRHTEKFLFEHDLKPLSAVKDMIGSQATKGMHVLAKFAPKIVSTGMWSDGGYLTVIEAYPSACKKSATLGQLLEPYIASRQALSQPPSTPWDGADFVAEIDHDDKRDALLCALVAWLFGNRPAALLQPDNQIPKSEGWIYVPYDILS